MNTKRTTPQVVPLGREADADAASVLDNSNCTSHRGFCQAIGLGHVLRLRDQAISLGHAGIRRELEALALRKLAGRAATWMKC